MTALAAVVLAHEDPTHLHRLVDALEDMPVFLHCDRRTPPAVFAEMTRGLPPWVTVLRRRPTTLASWSLVDAELAGLQAALTATDAEHVLVLSGSDYPLVGVDELRADLQPWQGMSRLQMIPLPGSFWNTRRHQDGGLWRFRFRFLVVRDQVVRVRGVPLRSPVTRAVPSELVLYASQQWKVLSRRHARHVLDVLAGRPDLRSFWRTCLVPEESCVASVLGSPALSGELTSSVVNELPWFMDWTPGAEHPGWLTLDHLEDLERARWAEPRRPSPPDLAVSPDADGGRKLFARKFSSHRDTNVLDEIDASLRSRAPSKGPWPAAHAEAST